MRGAHSVRLAVCLPLPHRCCAAALPLPRSLRFGGETTGGIGLDHRRRCNGCYNGGAAVGRAFSGRRPAAAAAAVVSARGSADARCYSGVCRRSCSRSLRQRCQLPDQLPPQRHGSQGGQGRHHRQNRGQLDEGGERHTWVERPQQEAVPHRSGDVHWPLACIASQGRGNVPLASKGSVGWVVSAAAHQRQPKLPHTLELTHHGSRPVA